MYEKRPWDISIGMCSDFDFPNHTHYDIELSICVEGTAGAICNDTPMELQKGDMMIVFSNEQHGYFKSGNGRQIQIIIKPGLLPYIFDDFSKYKYENFYLEHNPKIAELAEELFAEHHSSGIKNNKLEIAYISLILAIALKTLGRKPKKSGLTDFGFTEILEYISQNYTSDISLLLLAERFHTDYFNLSKMFTQKLSTSFSKYVNTLRIENAKRLLRHTNKKIFVIASESGFRDVRTFNRVFKQIVGKTPREYR